MIPFYKWRRNLDTPTFPSSHSQNLAEAVFRPRFTEVKFPVLKVDHQWALGLSEEEGLLKSTQTHGTRRETKAQRGWRVNRGYMAKQCQSWT